MPSMQKNHAIEFKGLTDWVEVFRAGSQTDSSGKASTWTQADLDQIVANHSDANPVPHTITHKKLFSPFAYAQGVAIKRDGDALLVKSAKVDPTFEKLITDGRLYERSVGIRKTDAGWKLDHIAWLGAEPPAVEGLAPVEFASGDDLLEFRAAVEFSRGSYAFGALARMVRNLREFVIEKFDLDTADRLVPEYQISDLQSAADDYDDEPEVAPLFSRQPANPETIKTNTGESPVPPKDEKTFTQAELDAAIAAANADATAKFTATQAELDSVKQARRIAEFQHEIDAAIDAGKLTPAQTEGMAEFMASLPADAEQTFEFARGEGDKAVPVKKTAADWFKEFVSSLKASKLTADSGAGDALDDEQHQFQLPAGGTVNPDDMQLYQRAKAHQKEKGGTFMDSYRAIGGQ